LGVGNAGQPANTITKEFSHGVAVAFDTTQITSPDNYSVPRAGAPCHPLASAAHPPAIAFQPRYFTRSNKTGGKPTQVAATLESGKRNGDSQQCVAVDTYNQTEHSTAQPVRSTASDVDHTGGVINPAERMAVRRLTPRECERLQGFPDDHTLIPWRGKSPQDCPDGPRYKALGNSMAVPCMAWIGKRIAAQHKGKVRYLSVCSGIEAASVAWEPLGWEPAAFAEVEKFPSAVLAHHWPQVPNLGDMTRHESWNLGAINLLVGGTPCQSFSVAGLRKGLHDPRGGLMLTFLEIAQRQRPRWIVWENVPGVLSSDGGRDFGAFLGALGALGYGFAYRVLDAQWFGVAQRRRRVFVVGCLGDGAAAATVLFESESVCRNPAPSREKGQGVAADAAGGSSSSRGGGHSVTGAIDCRIGAQRAQNAQAGHYVPEAIATLTARMQGSSGWAPYNETAHLLPQIVGALSDGAHQGGGLNGQDAYTGRIFACARQPADGADGQGDQHDLGRGADADCVPRRGREEDA
jgi:site-specific DNA-cytosine methylase